jgi:histo-blood group ABO system transferase
MKKILINVIATNKYLKFLDILSPSIENFFFSNSEITVLVHTNLDLPDHLIENYKRIKFVKHHIEHEDWPFTTLKRFHYFLDSESLLLENDYCFYIDADSKFIGEIKQEDLPSNGTIGTIHPCLFNGEGTPDRNPNSQAYIPYGSNNRYFCGGFFGASSNEFIKMSNSIKESIDTDLKNGVMAVWHDESHLNKWFFINPPNLVLNVPFAIAENLTQIQEDSKVLFLDKSTRGGHDFFRS